MLRSVAQSLLRYTVSQSGFFPSMPNWLQVRLRVSTHYVLLDPDLLHRGMGFFPGIIFFQRALIAADRCARDIVNFLVKNKEQWIGWRTLQQHDVPGCAESAK